MGGPKGPGTEIVVQGVARMALQPSSCAFAGVIWDSSAAGAVPKEAMQLGRGVRRCLGDGGLSLGYAFAWGGVKRVTRIGGIEVQAC